VGPHHYTFELFALDLKLNLGPDTTRADLLEAIDGHILDKAVLVGRFQSIRWAAVLVPCELQNRPKNNMLRDVS